MVLLGITPLYPIALLWSVIDVIRLNRQGLSPQFDKRETVWAVVLLFVIIPACFLILFSGSLFMWTWYKENYMYSEATLQEGKKIVAALYRYHHDLGRYPVDLSTLIEGRPLRADWCLDEWAQPYHYRVRPDGQRFTLISKGRDRTLGTADDIIIEE